MGRFPMQKNLHACVDEAICEVEQRLLEKGRESRAFGRDPLHALQLRADPPELEDNPAMAAGVTTKLWSITDMVRIIEEREDLKSGALLVGT